MTNTKELYTCEICGKDSPNKQCNQCGDDVNTNTKQTAKHTAGNWKIRLTSDNGGEVFSGVEETGLITDIIGNTIADTGISKWLNLRASSAQGLSVGDIDKIIAEKQANARLIATAPELLAACEKALEFIRQEFPLEHGRKDLGEAWGLIEEAIKKAKGLQ